MKKIKTITDVGKKYFSGKKVLLRLDLNVTLDEKGVVLDDFRIRKVLPTIKWLRSAGAKIIILSHIGRNRDDSLESVFEYLGQKIPLSFSSDLSEAGIVRAIENMGERSVLLCENLRQNEGEEKNDMFFANRFAQFADIYVNDAFSVSHRNHASIVSIPKLLPSYMGLLFAEEIKHLSAAFSPPRPFLFMLGGAKFETKLPLIKKFLQKADMCFIGGALAHNFFKAKGYEIGKSVIEETYVNISELAAQKNLLLPIDVRVKNSFGIEIKKPESLEKEDMILDSGPETVLMLSEKINQAKFILWNGPIGDYKIRGFEKSTEDLIHILSKIKHTENGLIVGGGDTAAMIATMGLENRFPFISTGGGAMLEYLVTETLPGIEALRNNNTNSN